MNKKIGIILIGIGLLLVVISFLMLGGSTPANKEKEDKNDYKFEYDYIKSRDISEKTKVTYPIYEGLSLDDSSIIEFNNSYSDEKGQSISAIVYSNENTLEKYEENRFEEYKKYIEELGSTVKKENITCSHLCMNYKVLDKENKISIDELVIYIKLSSTDIAELTYKSENAEISKDLINKVIENIKISHDSTYTIGTIEGDNLVIKFDLNNNKSISIKLDNSKYEEVETGRNGKYRTTIKDKSTDKTIMLLIQFKSKNDTLINDIDKIHNISIPGTSKNELTIDGKTIYEYITISGRGYAYLIDSDNALLLETISSSINVEDIVKNIEE